MKKTIIIMVFMTISLFSFSQFLLSDNLIPENTDSKIPENHTYLDTLWVLDSSITYMYNFIELVKSRKYTVELRNFKGNVIKSNDMLLDESSHDHSSYDSIVYFNGQDIKKHFNYVFSTQKNEWLSCNYEEYESPGILSRKTMMDFSAMEQDFTYGYDRIIKYKNGRADTSYYQGYDTETSSWTKKALGVHLYDDELGLETTIVYKMEGEVYTPYTKQDLYYIEDHQVRWTTYTYSVTTSEWIYDKDTYYNYNDLWLLDTTNRYQWNAETLEWENYRLSYYKYDNQNRLIDLLQLLYDEPTQAFYNWRHLIISYDEGSETNIEKLWSIPGGDFTSATKRFTSYIADGIADTIIGYYWNHDGGFFYKTKQEINEFDERLNIVTKYNYNHVNYPDLLTSRKEYFWRPFISSDIDEKSISSFIVYPNPADRFVNLVLPDGINSNNGVVIIYSITGKVLDKIKLSDNQFVWDCSDIPSGIYFYSSLLNHVTYSGKIVVR